MTLGKYSIGVGDRFGRQGKAQLAAVIQAQREGVDITPVWNKSFREHSIIGSTPSQTRQAADAAVRALDWPFAYFVDADHVSWKTVDRFIDACDFFTLDVADYIGQPADHEAVEAFVAAQRKLIGELRIDGVDTVFSISKEKLRAAAAKYLFAVQEAGRIYRRITEKRSEFIVEVSMDETDTPQTAEELLVILAALAAEGVPVRTIAPKFPGRFIKGVDYIGDLRLFGREFERLLAVIRFAVEHLPLPHDLKLSVHSGSDKFSIYPVIHRVLEKFDAGLHLKTAGTTWLEELIGLAEAGGRGLEIVKQIYHAAFLRREELCRPYAAVVDIDPTRLPLPQDVMSWSGGQFAAALRHEPTHPAFNPHLRQLLHVSFKIAAEMRESYLGALEDNQEIIAEKVRWNLFDRHFRPLFL